MSVHSLPARAAGDASSALAQAKVHLAAAHRLAVLHALEEGIDNHFTVTVPGKSDEFIILPFGLHWSEARASDMIVFNEAGETLNGTAGISVAPGDIIGQDHGWDVVLAGDIAYERDLAMRVFAWLEAVAARGAEVWIGDPGRSYLPRERLEKIAEYSVPVSRDLEDSEIKRTAVWRPRRPG